VVRDFGSARDLAGLRESLIFNCTGLGARGLFIDEELIPIRGNWCSCSRNWKSIT
jgi:hypothetical protein